MKDVNCEQYLLMRKYAISVWGDIYESFDKVCEKYGVIGSDLLTEIFESIALIDDGYNDEDLYGTDVAKRNIMKSYLEKNLCAKAKYKYAKLAEYRKEK